MEVFFIDYGNTEEVEHRYVKILAEQFAQLPAQALHCGLTGISGLGRDCILLVSKQPGYIAMNATLHSELLVV